MKAILVMMIGVAVGYVIAQKPKRRYQDAVNAWKTTPGRITYTQVWP